MLGANTIDTLFCGSHITLLSGNGQWLRSAATVRGIELDAKPC